MAVPKKKVSKARRDKRRSNNSKMSAPALVKCSNPECTEMILPHRVCKVCGWYDGKKVLEVEKAEKKD